MVYQLQNNSVCNLLTSVNFIYTVFTVVTDSMKTVWLNIRWKYSSIPKLVNSESRQSSTSYESTNEEHGTSDLNLVPTMGARKHNIQSLHCDNIQNAKILCTTLYVHIHKMLTKWNEMTTAFLSDITPIG